MPLMARSPPLPAPLQCTAARGEDGSPFPRVRQRGSKTGRTAPHNKLYRPEKDGLATTFAAFVAVGLGVRDPYRATPEQVGRIARGHLLLAHANAMQPGVFCLSSWDLVGALPVPEAAVAKWATDEDHRWVNRGGVDLLG